MLPFAISPLENRITEPPVCHLPFIRRADPPPALSRSPNHPPPILPDSSDPSEFPGPSYPDPARDLANFHRRTRSARATAMLAELKEAKAEHNVSIWLAEPHRQELRTARNVF